MFRDLRTRDRKLAIRQFLRFAAWGAPALAAGLCFPVPKPRTIRKLGRTVRRLGDSSGGVHRAACDDGQRRRMVPRFGCNEPVLDALVIPLAAVVGPELGQRPLQARLTDKHQAVQAFLFDRANEPLGVRIAIRRTVRRLDDAHADVPEQSAGIPSSTSRLGRRSEADDGGGLRHPRPSDCERLAA